MISWGACSSLHPMVQGAETLLGRADNACAALRRCQSPISAVLVQLHQALIDGRTNIQRDYDHLSNRFGSDKAAQGDQTSCLEFWMISGRIEEGITKPLEELIQHLMHHSRDQHGGHFYSHCHYCYEYHHHHNSHHHHHGHHHNHHHDGWLIFLGNSPSHHHYNNSLFEYDSRFQDIMNKWGTIRDDISSSFDSLEDRLKKAKDKTPDSGSGNGNGNNNNSGSKKNGSVADVVHNLVEVTGRMDEDIRLLENADERIRMIGRHVPRRGRSRSSSSGSSST